MINPYIIFLLLSLATPIILLTQLYISSGFEPNQVSNIVFKKLQFRNINEIQDSNISKNESINPHFLKSPLFKKNLNIYTKYKINGKLNKKSIEYQNLLEVFNSQNIKWN